MDVALIPARQAYEDPVDLDTLCNAVLGAHEIRTLVLLPGHLGDPVNCQLVKQSLDSPGLSYQALSYMWGPAEPVQSICIDGVRINVRYNLYATLRCIRLQRDRRTIWIDAVCINQENISERNSQVAMMSEIYTKASQVLVWLGEADVNSDAVLDTFQYFYCPMSLHDINPGRIVSGKKLRRGINSILQRQYWRRLWIIQEVISASKLHFYCGTKQIPASCFSKILTAPWFKEDFRDTPARLLFNRRDSLRVREATQDCAPLNILLDLCKLCVACKSQCQDIKDRIYGVLGLVSRFGAETGLTDGQPQAFPSLAPDYSKSPAELYVDVFWFFCQVLESGIYKGSQGDLAEFTGEVYRCLRTIQRLLEFPVWNKEGRFFEPLHNICGAKRQSVLGTVVSAATLRGIGLISRIGPEAEVPAELLIKSASLSLWGESVYKKRLLQCTTLYFHKTQTIGTRYTFNHQSGILEYVPANTDTARASFTPSDGHCRLFMIDDQIIGVSSHDIREGDILCQLFGPEDMFVIVRLEDRMDNNTKNPFDFRVIALAMILWHCRSSHEMAMDVKFFFHAEHWDSKHNTIMIQF